MHTHTHTLTGHPASLSAHSPSRAPRTRRENFSCLIAWVQVRGGELQWRRLIVAFSAASQSSMPRPRHTPTPEGGRATFRRGGCTPPFQLRLSGVCVWAAGRRMLINTCYLTIKQHNLGLCCNEKGELWKAAGCEWKSSRTAEQRRNAASFHSASS